MASETKDRILDVAERLFADRGYPATSLRDITAEAGVNLASVNYHFGTKEALLAALLDRRFVPLNRRRLELLDAIEADVGSGQPRIEDVLRALLAPPFEKQREWGEAGRTFMRLVGRLHAEVNDQHRATYLRHFDEIRRRFTAALHRALPHLDTEDVHWRMLFLIGSMSFAIMSGGLTQQTGGMPPRDPDAVLDALLCFAVGGVGAPAPAAVPVAAGRFDRKGRLS
jgi:AcrR family transcriptional regulator